MTEYQTDPGANRPPKCPLLSAPQAECYCVNLGSLTTEAVVYYCGGNYDKCRIYQDYLAQGGREA